MKLKKYRIEVQVTDVDGSSTFEIEAESPREAIEKYKNGDCIIVAEDLSVMGYEEPEIDDIELIEEK